MQFELDIIAMITAIGSESSKILKEEILKQLKKERNNGTIFAYKTI
jgi:hypothetical protein